MGARPAGLPHHVEHAGPPSIPALPAKPAPDLPLTVPGPADEDAYVPAPALARLGPRPTIRRPDRNEHRLLRGAPTPAASAVDLRVLPETARTLRFRDPPARHPGRPRPVRAHQARAGWAHVAVHPAVRGREERGGGGDAAPGAEGPKCPEPDLNRYAREGQRGLSSPCLHSTIRASWGAAYAV
ncbi:GrpB family protein [Streptomyces diastaticus]